MWRESHIKHNFSIPETVLSFFWLLICLIHIQLFQVLIYLEGIRDCLLIGNRCAWQWWKMATEKEGPGLILRSVGPAQLREVVARPKVTTDISAEMWLYSTFTLFCTSYQHIFFYIRAVADRHVNGKLLNRIVLTEMRNIGLKWENKEFLFLFPFPLFPSVLIISH